jgi:hypothetical protein
MLEERRKRRGEVRDNRRNRRKEERRAEKEDKTGKKGAGKDKASGDKKTDVTAKTGKVSSARWRLSRLLSFCFRLL